MSILSEDGYLAAAKQLVSWVKTASRTSIAAIPFSVFDLAGQPGAGTLAGSNTANGVVPTDATTGVPVVNAFSGANKGYLSRVAYGASVACRLFLYDMLFKAGAYSFNSNVTLASQPSYSTRIPGGDYKSTEIWIETVTAFTGNLTVTITYTNENGTTARSTGSFAPAVAPTVGRMFRVPLQAGDNGVQKIESVVSSVATAGTFNVLVLRRLWTNRVKIANDGDVDDLYRTGMPELFADSALIGVVQPDSTATGIPELEFEIANG